MTKRRATWLLLVAFPAGCVTTAVLQVPRARGGGVTYLCFKRPAAP